MSYYRKPDIHIRGKVKFKVKFKVKLSNYATKKK